MTRFIQKITRARNCPLCAAKTLVDYKDVALLRRYISERGKIQGRARGGICAFHQRAVTRAIKRARVVALIPFSQS